MAGSPFKPGHQVSNFLAEYTTQIVKSNLNLVFVSLGMVHDRAL